MHRRNKVVIRVGCGGEGVRNGVDFRELLGSFIVIVRLGFVAGGLR